ncbi:MAG TPA: alpha/beta fold hydrolase, partial [Candidatus Nanopelagicales bacterium]|nr:alpha/beta fold hydrolase [Candidatus Nanopelagicales bacterium]
WEECAPMHGGGGPESSCALVGLPLDRDDPDGEQLSVFVKRVRGPEPPTRQLWLLAGGPGVSGAAFDGAVEQLLALDRSLEIFIPDHRGTGRSTRLGCPDESLRAGPPSLEAWEACAAALQEAWGDRLDHFSTTAAAQDLGALIEAAAEPDREVHIYGVSYGTVWAQRYLQLFPEQPDAVTLDSLLHARIGLPFWMDTWHDRAGRELLDRCAADPVCSAKMGPDPEATVEAFFASLDAETCVPLWEQKVTRSLMRQLFAVLLRHHDLRAAIPALAYRGLRCNPGDAAAIVRAIGFVSTLAEPPPDPLLYAPALGMHIMLSELSSQPPPRLDVLELYQQMTLISPDRGVFHRALHDRWPRYDPGPLAAEYPETSVPLLMLHGTLDPQVPVSIAQEIASHYRAPGQSLVTLDPAVHGAVLGSPTASPPHTPCGLSIWLGFLRDPTAPLDTSCVDELAPIPFAGTPELAERVLGTSDLWESPPG